MFNELPHIASRLESLGALGVAVEALVRPAGGSRGELYSVRRWLDSGGNRCSHRNDLSHPKTVKHLVTREIPAHYLKINPASPKLLTSAFIHIFTKSFNGSLIAFIIVQAKLKLLAKYSDKLIVSSETSNKARTPMSKSFKQYIRSNEVSHITLGDEDTQFSSCDATGLMSDCLVVEVTDVHGAVWGAEINRHDVIDFINAD